MPGRPDLATPSGHHTLSWNWQPRDRQRDEVLEAVAEMVSAVAARRAGDIEVIVTAATARPEKLGQPFIQ